MIPTKKLTKALRATLAAPKTAPKTEWPPSLAQMRATAPETAPKNHKPAGVTLNLKTYHRKWVTLTRGEEAKAVIVAVPKPDMLEKYRKEAGDQFDSDYMDGTPSEREQAVAKAVRELFDAVNALKLSDFYVSRDPEYIKGEVVVDCNDAWLSKKFDFRMRVEGDWRSDGGEMTIHDEVYSKSLDPRW